MRNLDCQLGAANRALFCTTPTIAIHPNTDALSTEDMFTLAKLYSIRRFLKADRAAFVVGLAHVRVTKSI